jgi:hypothetical protein
MIRVLIFNTRRMRRIAFEDPHEAVDVLDLISFPILVVRMSRGVRRSASLTARFTDSSLDFSVVVMKQLADTPAVIVIDAEPAPWPRPALPEPEKS